MNMKTIIALAGVAVAAVASASTNYVKVAARNRNLVATVKLMSRDPALSSPAAFRTALEDLDRSSATSKVPFNVSTLSRRCPLTVRAVLERDERLSAKVHAGMIAVCGYDAKNRSTVAKPDEPGFINSQLQLASLGLANPAAVRKQVLNAAIVPIRRAIRRSGGTFVGEKGAAKVKETLDALAAELNAPRFGKALEMLEGLGIDVEAEFIRSKMLTDEEIKAISRSLLDGEIPFSGNLQRRFGTALGVTAYNEFVREYNGK